MQGASEHAPSATNIADQALQIRREFKGPLFIAAGGVLTFAWTGFLGWGALRLVIYVFN